MKRNASSIIGEVGHSRCVPLFQKVPRYVLPMPESLTSKQAKTYNLQLGAKGRLVLPAGVRKHLNLQQGDRLMLNLETDGSMRLVSLRYQIKQLRGLLKAPSRNVVNEFIQKRREEAQHE